MVGGEAVTGGYSGVVIYESHLSTTCTAAASDDDVHFLEGGTEREAHHQLHLPHGPWCETAYVCPWQLQWIHQGKPYLTTALTVVWLTPQT